MLKKPIELHIYDDNGEVKDTYKLCIIPWKVMKKFVNIIESMGDKFSDMELFDKCDGVLCDAFHNQFDEQTLADHADSAEVLSALTSIFAAIEGTGPNAVKGRTKTEAPKNTTPNGGADAN